MSNKKSTTKTIINRFIYYFVMTILVCVFVGSAAYLINYFWQSKKSEDKFNDLKDLIISDDDDKSENQETIDDNGSTEYVPKEIEYVEINGVKVQKKFEKIYKKNSDFIGWLKINDTEIDYPVMQTMANEEYYIDRDFDKEYSSAGTLFVDTSSDVEKPSDSILIYGHNMKTGKMFHDLLNYEEESFYQEHKIITFDTIYGNGTYEVIAAFRTKIQPKDYVGFKYYQFFDAENAYEFDSYVNECKNMTPYNIPTTAKYGDELITLSTCAYHDKEGRYVVVAKKIKWSYRNYKILCYFDIESQYIFLDTFDKICYILFCWAGVSELADEADSKSVDGNIVWVQVPSPASKKHAS